MKKYLKIENNPKNRNKQLFLLILTSASIASYLCYKYIMKQRKRTKNNTIYSGSNICEELAEAKLSISNSNHRRSVSNQDAYLSSRSSDTRWSSAESKNGSTKSLKSTKKSTIQMRREEKSQKRIAAITCGIDNDEANYAARFLSRTDEKGHSKRISLIDDRIVSSPDSSRLKNTGGLSEEQERVVDCKAQMLPDENCVHNQDTQDSFCPKENQYNSPTIQRLASSELVKSPKKTKENTPSKLIEEEIKPDINNLNITSVKNSNPTKKTLKLNSQVFNNEAIKSNITKTLEDIKQASEESKHAKEVHQKETHLKEVPLKDEQKDSQEEEKNAEAPGRPYIWDLLRKKTEVKLKKQLSSTTPVENASSSDKRTAIENEDKGGKDILEKKQCEINTESALLKPISEDRSHIHAAPLIPIQEEKSKEKKLSSRSEFMLLKAGGGGDPRPKKQGFFNNNQGIYNNNQPKKIINEDKKGTQPKNNKKKDPSKKPGNSTNYNSSQNYTSTSNNSYNSYGKYDRKIIIKLR